MDVLPALPGTAPRLRLVPSHSLAHSRRHSAPPPPNATRSVPTVNSNRSVAPSRRGLYASPCMRAARRGAHRWGPSLRLVGFVIGRRCGARSRIRCSLRPWRSMLTAALLADLRTGVRHAALRCAAERVATWRRLLDSVVEVGLGPIVEPTEPLLAMQAGGTGRTSTLRAHGSNSTAAARGGLRGSSRASASAQSVQLSRMRACARIHAIRAGASAPIIPVVPCHLPSAPFGSGG